MTGSVNNSSRTRPRSFAPSSAWMVYTSITRTRSTAIPRSSASRARTRSPLASARPGCIPTSMRCVGIFSGSSLGGMVQTPCVVDTAGLILYHAPDDRGRFGGLHQHVHRLGFLVFRHHDQVPLAAV